MAFNRELFAEILDSIDDAYIAFDAEGNTVCKNSAFLSLSDNHAKLEQAGLQLVLSNAHVNTVNVNRTREITTSNAQYRLRVTHAGNIADPSRLMLVAYERVVSKQKRKPLAPHYRLTPREMQVAELISEGRTNHDVATVLGVSYHTVRHHTARLLAKLRVKRRGEVAALFWSDSKNT